MPNRKKGRPNWSPLLLTERSKFSTQIAKMLMGDAASCARSIRLHVDVIGVARDVIGGERTGSATGQSRHFGRGFSPMNGHRQSRSTCLKRATSGRFSAGHLTRRWHPMAVKRAIGGTA